MSKYSLVFRNATVIDGTGNPGYLADVAILNDRIAQIGSVSENSGIREIDLSGLTLCPGFIEGHTHYDPQLCWDKLATPTAQHGVTTILTGSCSFTIAPVTPKTQPMIVGLFKKAEDLSQSYFDNAVPFSWSTFPEWIDYVKPNLGINVAPYIGHTPLRHWVMGDDAQKRAATDAEVAQMCAILREAVRAGAVGLSMSLMDCDENNIPIATRWADTAERIALAHVLAEEGRGLIMADLDMGNLDGQFQQMQEFADISIATGVNAELLGIFDTPLDKSLYKKLLSHIESLNQQGAKLAFQTTTKSFDQFFELSNSFFTFFLMSHWKEVMSKPVPDRKAAFEDLQQRQHFQDGVEPFFAMMCNTSVDTVHSPENEIYLGRKLVDIAAEENKRWVDVMFEIALRDNLETRFAILNTVHADVEAVGEIINHPLVHLAGSDGGAHVTQFCTAGDTTWTFQHWVRTHKKMSLERAVRRFTGELADYYHLQDRGYITEGKFADLVVFDPDTIAKLPDYRKSDLPDGNSRYVADAEGINYVVVNGEILLEENRYLPARAGRIV